MRLPLPAYLPAGAERVELGLVQDGVGWHDGTASVRLQRARGRRVLVRTGISTFRHLGDDLIARELLGALARNLPDVIPVLLAHPTDDLADRFGCEVATSPIALGRKPRDLVSQARLLARGQEVEDPLVAEALEPFRSASALVLAPGGGLASRYAAEALEPSALEVLIAHAMGIPVLVEGASVGPIDARKDQAAIAELLNDAQRITVRDAGSATVARRIGRGVDAAVVPDLATAAVGHLGRARAAAADWLASINVPADRRYAVVSLRGATADASHVETVRHALSQLPEHTAWLFLPHIDDDLALLDADQWAAAHLVPVAPMPDQVLAAIVAGATMAMGSRFHHSVIATAAGVRTVALVRNDYDRVRIKALEGASGLQIVAIDRPDDAAAAAAELLGAPDPVPAARWDAAGFAAALAARLPAPPPLG
ncbi:MAG: polysaccharide pyruvyl transferase family protein [Acidimicrobiales bacterium]